MTGICAAVDAAHAAGVLHRDLKPENILLPEGRSVAKVLDFGIAKTRGRRRRRGHDDTLTAAGMPIGTPAYMAPEQLAGTTVTPRTDVFSLGVLAYELVTGELPFGRGRSSTSPSGSSALTRRPVSPSGCDGRRVDAIGGR